MKKLNIFFGFLLLTQVIIAQTYSVPGVKEAIFKPGKGISAKQLLDGSIIFTKDSIPLEPVNTQDNWGYNWSAEKALSETIIPGDSIIILGSHGVSMIETEKALTLSSTLINIDTLCIEEVSYTNWNVINKGVCSNDHVWVYAAYKDLNTEELNLHSLDKSECYNNKLINEGRICNICYRLETRVKLIVYIKKEKSEFSKLFQTLKH